MGAKYEDKFVKCPYYRRHEDNRIACEGLRKGNTVNLVFEQPQDKRLHMHEYCYSIFFLYARVFKGLDYAAVPQNALEILQAFIVLHIDCAEYGSKPLGVDDVVVLVCLFDGKAALCLVDFFNLLEGEGLRFVS